MVLVAVIIATVVVTVFTVDIGRISIGGKSIRTVAESQASKFLERKMRIGAIRAYLTPGKFAFEDVVIEGPTSDARPFFSARRITVEVPWWTLFRKDRDLYIDVRLYDWRMVVEKWPDGQAHLPKLTSKGQGGKFPAKIRSLSVIGSGGEFIYDDHLTPWRVTGPNLKFALVRANNLNTYVGQAQFTKGAVQIQNFEPMSADFSTRFQVDGGVVRLKHIDLLTDGAESHISGFVNFGRWPEQEYRIQSTVDFNRMRELFFAKATWRLSGEGRFNGVFKIFKNGFDLSGLFRSDEAGLGLGNSEWRFVNLDGALQWAPDHFIVSRADAEFLGGRMRLAYGLSPFGQPGGATATLTADYSGVDLYRFTRQFGWTALEPQGSMRGQVSMAWHNGQFTETLQGRGATVVAPPDGQSLATAVLPPGAEPVPAERPFQKYRPFGEFAIGADAAYRFTGSTLDFDPGWVATPTTFVRFQGHARGGDVNVPFHVTSHDWQNGDRLFSAIMSNFGHPTGAIDVGGRGTFDGALTKAFNAPRIDGRFDGDLMRAWGVVWGATTGRIVIENGYLDLIDGRIATRDGGRVLTSGRYALGFPRADHGEEIHATIHAEQMPMQALRTAFDLEDWPVDGTLAEANLELTGAYEKPAGRGTMRIENGTAWKEPFNAVGGELLFDGDGSVRMHGITLVKGAGAAGGTVTGTAHLSWAEKSFSVDAASEGLPVEEIAAFRFEGTPLHGMLRGFKARGSGSFDRPVWDVEGYVPDLYIADEGIGVLRGTLTLENNELTIKELAAASERLDVGCQGTIQLNAVYDAKVNCRFAKTSLDPYFKFVGRELPLNQVIASGSFSVAGPLKDTTRLAVDARVDDASLRFSGYLLEIDKGEKGDSPLQLAFRENAFRLVRVRFQGKDTSLDLSGTADLTARAFDVTARGQASLGVLQAFYPTLTASGSATLGARLTGSFDKPELTGRADITDGKLRPEAMPQGLSEINGPITFAAGRISVDGLQAVLGEGPVFFTGGIVLDGYRPDQFDLHAKGESLHLRYPDGLQSTVIAGSGPDRAGHVSDPLRDRGRPARVVLAPVPAGEGLFQLVRRRWGRYRRRRLRRCARAVGDSPGARDQDSRTDYAVRRKQSGQCQDLRERGRVRLRDHRSPGDHGARQRAAGRMDLQRQPLSRPERVHRLQQSAQVRPVLRSHRGGSRPDAGPDLPDHRSHYGHDRQAEPRVECGAVAVGVPDHVAAAGRDAGRRHGRTARPGVTAGTSGPGDADGRRGHSDQSGHGHRRQRRPEGHDDHRASGADPR